MSLFKFIAVFTVTLLATQFVSAELVSTKLNTESASLSVGEEFTIKLSVSPIDSVPVYTVFTTLKYDPTKVEIVKSVYGDEWVSLNIPEVQVTNRRDGLLTRAAGLPGGVKGSKEFITYTFKGIQNGPTTIKVINGEAYNENNTDVGVNTSSLDINIGEEEVSSTTKSSTYDLNLNITGDNAFYKEESYSFDVYFQPKATKQAAITKAWVLNLAGYPVYQDEQEWTTSPVGTIKNFVIPGGMLDEGNYRIVVRTRYENGVEEDDMYKDVGVLSNGENWVTKNKNLILPIFIFIVAFAVLHHFMIERNMYDKLRRIKKSSS